MDRRPDGPQNNGKMASLPGGFTYQDLRIVAIDPTSCVTGGGKPVHIKGSGFVNVKKVTFGGVEAKIKAQTPTQIDVETPPHAAGDVDVVVELASGPPSKSPQQYKYIPPPP